MNPSLRRNACPSLAAPMRTGDGLLVRINTTTGAISPQHLALIADAAARHGNGILEVTRRGSLQVRGLTAESAQLFSNEVLESGMEVRSGVSIETAPLAGLDPTEIADPRQIVSQLVEKIGETDLAERLGPKVSVVVDGGGQSWMGEVLADVRLTAVADLCWQVSVGGTAEGARVTAVDSKIAVELASALLGAIAAQGRSGRWKDLTEAEISKACKKRLGPDKTGVRSTLPTSVLPDISPARGEIGSCGLAAPSATSPAGESRAAEAISPLAGGPKDGQDQRLAPASGRTEEGDVERGHARPVPTGLPIGEFVLKDNRVALGLGLPFGQASAAQLSALAQTAENTEISEFRLAPGRALLAICGTATKARRFGQAAARLGFIVDPRDTRLRIVACAGAPACSSGLIQTKEIATKIVTGGMLPETGPVHVSGCAKRCAEPASAAFAILGTPDGASVIEGKDGRELARVAEREAAAAFQRVLASRGVGRDTKPAPRVRHRKSA